MLPNITEQPHDLDTEFKALGAILILEQIPADLDLTPDDFYRETHRKMYALFQKVQADGQPVRYDTVLQRIKKPHDAAPYLTRCIYLTGGDFADALANNDTTYKDLLTGYSQTLRRYWLERQRIIHGTTAIQQIAKGDIRQAIDTLNAVMAEGRAYGSN